MKNDWERYDRLFGNTRVRAYVILRDGYLQGTIGIKYPKDGAGRLTVAVHDHGPVDPVFIDLCDEMGFYFMAEAFDEWD